MFFEFVKRKLKMGHQRKREIEVNKRVIITLSGSWFTFIALLVEFQLKI